MNGLIADTQILPLVVGSEEQSPREEISISDLYEWNLKLAQIQHKFSNIVSQAGSESTKLVELGKMDTLLISWCAGLPIEARPGEDILVSDDIRHLVVSLHLEYYNMVRSIHWASFNCAYANKDHKYSSLSARIIGSETICLSAARSFVNALNR